MSAYTDLEVSDFIRTFAPEYEHGHSLKKVEKEKGSVVHCAADYECLERLPVTGSLSFLHKERESDLCSDSPKGKCNIFISDISALCDRYFPCMVLQSIDIIVKTLNP